MRPLWLHLSPFPPHSIHREVMFQDFKVSGIVSGNQEGTRIILTAPHTHSRLLHNGNLRENTHTEGHSRDVF